MTMTVLIVDDNEDNRWVLQDALADEGYRLREASNGVEALQRIEEEPPDLVLLDIMMPEMDGLECCRRLQTSDETRRIPIILVTALSDDEAVVQGLDAGAVDYIAKPFVGAVIRARVSAALRTKAALDEMQRSREHAEQLAVELEAKNRELADIALRDGLTGLPNRVLLMDRLRQAHARSRRKNDRFALLFLDFDGFKLVNDTLGHEAGDELLKSIADRLRDELREFDTVAGPGPLHTPSRLGGDEFVILLEGLLENDDAVRIADRLQRTLAKPHEINGQSIVSTASIGIVTNERDYESADAMLRDADIAMYRAKESGRACSVKFDQGMHEALLDRVDQERTLREAVAQNRITAAYQPIISLTHGTLIGCEAIARWDHPERGMLVAEEFLPFADEIGLIVDIGERLLTDAIRQVGRWQRSDSGCIPPRIMVNVWERQLRHPGFVDLIAGLLADERVPAEMLSLEIPESVFTDRRGPANTVIDALRGLGVQLAMDACGGGRSAMTGLHEMPIDVLKIDRTVIANLDARQNHTAVVHAVITLAHNLGMKVAAVGIETHAQLAQLQALECDHGQGRLFMDPLPADQLVQFLESDGTTVSIPGVMSRKTG